MASENEIVEKLRELNQLNEELTRVGNVNIERWTVQEKYENLIRMHNLRADIFAYERLLLIEYEAEICAKMVNVS